MNGETESHWRIVQCQEYASGLSASGKDVVGFLPQCLAGPQDGLREIRVVDGVRPDLRFQAEPGEGTVAVAFEAGDRERSS